MGFDVLDSLLAEVRYTNDRLAIRFEGDGPKKRLEKHFVTELLITKYIHWEYEEEVRVFVRLEDEHLEAGSYFCPFDKTLALREVILGPLCTLPIEQVRALVRSTYDDVTVIKSRLAYKWFSVVADEQSVNDENAYWEGMGKTPPYVPAARQGENPN